MTWTERWRKIFSGKELKKLIEKWIENIPVTSTQAVWLHWRLSKFSFILDNFDLHSSHCYSKSFGEFTFVTF